MRNACRVFAMICLLASVFATAEPKENARTIILPSPQLIHCHSAECSQLWKQGSPDGAAVYPSQVLTDLVNGEVVGLTAVYDKSVSKEELRDALNRVYEKWARVQANSLLIWRIESEQLAISVFDGIDGAKEVSYLKFGTYESHVPAAHLDCKK